MELPEIHVSNTSLKSSPTLNGSKNKFDSRKYAKVTVNVDEALEHHVGACGLWQWMILILAVICSPSMATFPVFVNSVPEFRCQMEPEAEEFFHQQNLTFHQVSSIVGPRDNTTPSLLIGCTRYQRDWTSMDVLLNYSHIDSPPPAVLEGTATENCPSGYVFQYNQFQYPGSIVAEYDLICSKAWISPLGTSIFLVGLCGGFILGGWAGDTFGRRNTALAFCVVELLAGIGTSLSRNHHMYHAMRTVVGICNTGKATVLRLLPIELTLAKYRGYFTSAIVIGVAFAHRSLMAGFAWFIEDWRWLNAACMAPGIFSLLFFCLLPESPRWLISQSRTADAIDVLRTGYRINHLFVKDKKPFDVNRFLKYTDSQSAATQAKAQGCFERKSLTARLQSLVRFNRPSRYTVVTLTIAILVFTAQSFSFFGILLYAKLVNNYIYITAVINSATAIPGPLIASVAYRLCRYRRRPLLISYLVMFVSLAVGGLYTIIRQDTSDIVLNIACNLALVFSSATITMLTIYVSELFPSDMRARAVGFSSGFGRLGSTVSTFINELDKYLNHGVPIVIYSMSALLQAMVLLLLKDTSGENLPDMALSVESIPDRAEEPRANNHRQALVGRSNNSGVSLHASADISTISV